MLADWMSRLIYVKHREHTHTHACTYIWPPVSDDPGGDELGMLRAAAYKSKNCFSFCVLCDWTVTCTVAKMSKHKISFKQNKVEH